jgi:group II intron reverse transcriptase/maturase
MPTWSDKVLQEVLRLILEAYYEPQFSDRSHGFRPERGCHTALQEIYYHWPATVWFIEGDISQCFDKLDHAILLKILSEKIQDQRFLRLISELLKAGYLEEWKFHATLSGTPQGGILSPLLANIYLDRLDKYVEKLIPAHTMGTERQPNQEYMNLLSKAKRLRDRGKMEEARAVKAQAQAMPSRDPKDPNFRRLRYVRYADDFLLGVIGPKEEAEGIKQQLGEYLQGELKLDLSQAKTLITRARTDVAKFLGYEIHVIQSDTKRTHIQGNRRNVNGRIGLRIPPDVIEEKCQSYQKNGKAIHRADRLLESDFTIIATYQAEYRGIVEYYRLAYNLHNLNKLRWIMDQSLVGTLANKFKIPAPQVVKKYKTTVLVKGKAYKVLQVTKERPGKKPLIARWGGISLQWNIKTTLNDQPYKVWAGRTELEKRLLAATCEYCGDTAEVQIQVHHIRALKDLNRYRGREKPEWVKIMAARQRKTLVLCQTCHADIHAGRPMTRPKLMEVRR